MNEFKIGDKVLYKNTPHVIIWGYNNGYVEIKDTTTIIDPKVHLIHVSKLNKTNDNP